MWVRHLSWRLTSEATRRIHTRVHRPCLPLKIHPESRVGRNLLMPIHSSVMKRHTARGLPVDDMPKSSDLAAQTGFDAAAFLPQAPSLVKDEDRTISRSLDTDNPQVDMEVSMLAGSSFIPQLRWLDRYSFNPFRQCLSINAGDSHLRAWDSAPC